MTQVKIKSIKSSAEFIRNIEQIVRDTGTDYMDAIIHYCEKNNIEIDVAASVVRNNPYLKSHIQLQAENLNFLPKQARLPM